MLKRDFIRNILLLILAVLVFLILRIFIFSSYKITANDANSYLKTNDTVIINKNINPDYKDFVVYEVDDKDYVGRVVGLSTDTATFMDDIFYLNNSVEEEPYLTTEKTSYDAEGHQNPFTEDFTIESITANSASRIPKGSYLILNDDRRNTEDSRTFGLIKKSQIKGVITFRVLPISEFGFLAKE